MLIESWLSKNFALINTLRDLHCVYFGNWSHWPPPLAPHGLDSEHLDGTLYNEFINSHWPTLVQSFLCV